MKPVSTNSVFSLVAFFCAVCLFAIPTQAEHPLKRGDATAEVKTGVKNGAKIEIGFDELKELLDSRSSRVEAAEFERQAALDREGSLGRSFFPTIEAYGAQQTFKTGSTGEKFQPTFGAEAKINVFNGSRDQIESEVRALEADRKTIQLQQTVSDELQVVRKAFWDIVFAQEKIEQIEAAITVNSQNLAAAQRRIRSGVGTESDRVEFEMKAVDLKRESSLTKLNVSNLIRDFAVLLNFRPSDQLVFPKRLDHNHDFEAVLKHEAKDHEFLYKDDEFGAAQSELAAKIQHRSWWPAVEAFAAYNEYDERIDSAGPNTSSDMRKETVLGVRMKMQIGNLFEYSKEASSLSNLARASRKRADFKKRQVEAHMQSEFAELRFLHDQVHDAEENIVRAERYYKLTQSEYARGVKNSPDVLGASEKLFENQIKRLEIIKDFQIVKAHVLAKIGK